MSTESQSAAAPAAKEQTREMMNYELFQRLLCCPSCKGDVRPDIPASELHCDACEFTFPVVDGIPVMFPGNVKENMEELFGRYWDTPEKAELYDTKVEGDGIFGVYNHESEIYGLIRYFNPANMDIVLDAGTGNARFMETFPAHSFKVGVDASLNLLKRCRARGRGDLMVCAELENLPFKSDIFGTVISCRVLQHLTKQREAVHEMARVTRPKGDMILELYNTWNLKTIYKNIRMSKTLGPMLNAPFRLVFKSMSPFADWGINYDNYNGWFQTKGWMAEADLKGFEGRGVGWGINKYFFGPFFIFAMLENRAPSILKAYCSMCSAVEKAIGSVIPWRYTMEKFSIKGTKGEAPTRVGLIERVTKKIGHQYKSSDSYNNDAHREKARESDRGGAVVQDNAYHIGQAIEWLERAQDATPDRGVSRGYSVGWNAHFDSKGWQPSYPETTGYIIPTLYDTADWMNDAERSEQLRKRAQEMAEWEIEVQMASGAVMGGTVERPQTPAVFNTGQVMLGWLRTHQETGDSKFLDASERAARFLVSTQDADGAWRKGNSQFADPAGTTYNSRVGWALILHGRISGNQEYVDAGVRNITFTASQQTASGWFENNCLSDASAPLLHTICYAIEGLLGAYDEVKDDDFLRRARLAADGLIEAVQPDGSIPGRLDANWKGTVSWNCLTGSAQLAGVMLRLHAITRDDRYLQTGRNLLAFLKSTQNCVSNEDGLRGGIKGSFPFDGDYGRFELLNWATKFFVDALLLDEKTTAS